ncbi:hypothetical protein Tco_1219906 [Tanacetum coccineum]
MAPTTRRGPNTPVNNTNPNNMTPESIQAMIDQALLRELTMGWKPHNLSLLHTACHILLSNRTLISEEPSRETMMREISKVASHRSSYLGYARTPDTAIRPPPFTGLHT